MNGILAFWEAISEQNKAALFSLICWLVYGLVIRVWAD